MSLSKIKNLSTQTTINNFIAGSLLVSGTIVFSMMFGGTKYYRDEICFDPTNNQSPEFCTDDKRYLVLSEPNARHDSIPSNPRYQDDNYILPDYAKKVRVIEPSNKNYLTFGFIGTGLFTIGLGMFSYRTQINLNRFPLYCEKYKSEIYTEYLRGSLERKSAKLQLKIAEKAKYDEQERIILAMDELKNQAYADSLTPTQIDEMRLQLSRQNELEELEFNYNKERIIAETAKVKKDGEKANMELVNMALESKVSVNDEIEYPSIDGVTWFNFDLITGEYNSYPHIRIVGATGSGKTLLADYILLFVEGFKKVITSKKLLFQWQNCPNVIGVPEQWDVIDKELKILPGLRKDRLAKASEGTLDEDDVINIVIDEWRAIKTHVNGAKDIIRDMITLARESKIRLILMAQGRQVETWGLEGESDLAECFASFYIGKFAISQARAYYKENQRFINEDTATKVMEFLEKQGSRALWVSSGNGEYPGAIPEFEIPNQKKKIEKKS